MLERVLVTRVQNLDESSNQVISVGSVSLKRVQNLDESSNNFISVGKGLSDTSSKSGLV